MTQKKKWPVWLKVMMWIGIIGGGFFVMIMLNLAYSKGLTAIAQRLGVPYSYYHHMHHERHHYEEQYMANDFDEVGLILAILTVLGGVYLCFSLLEDQEKKYKKRATKQHNKRLIKVKKRH